ncbi:molybdopterin oxidoreductase family protein [Ferrovibrio sp.]|uniref:molybdopterin oxidoreductase family protein n=1 Tax=Ferrovibrio sp. TaxID=1917215 RepID=UPI000CB4C1C4|nr:molybdopterin oxidoreductase family protein [Ferrovibrio sp.]PJI39114.1 MAG: dehydrogenase [Ferrovibrio sp.]
MNAPFAPSKADSGKLKPQIGHSACPHDCPSTCALEIELTPDGRIGRVRGAEENNYTAGVICAKVARYAERANHKERVLQPLLRTGPKGSTQFKPISWEEALDRTAEAFIAAEKKHGSEAVWPYYYAGTMGLVQRDGINRLRHVKKYSGQHSTICVTLARAGYIAATGSLHGPDPREMAKSDLIVIWGTNAVHTQVNVMTHAIRARKERGAKIVVVDAYRNATAEQADVALVLRPGTDGALACGVMHVLFRDGYADRDYLARHTDAPAELEAHLQDKTPEWASAITGLTVEQITGFAHMLGRTKKHYIRLGYGFARSRNGAVNMHAATCIASVTGSWQYEGGGAFHNNGAIFHWNKTLIDGLDSVDPSIRTLDQSQIGPILTGDAQALKHGGPVTALLIQNTNPMEVAPESELVKRGFARDDLFACVHEQFMTLTAKMADIVLPATMFTEHDDIYQAGGQQHILLGPKLVEAPGEARENHYMISELAKRLGAKHHGFEISAIQMVEETLKASGWPDVATLRAQRWHDCQPDFDTAHYAEGFAWPDRKFRFKPDWAGMGPDHEGMPALPDHWLSIEPATGEHPFRMITSPARNFLNTSFTETPTSVKREGRPTLFIHPEDAAVLQIADGELVRIGNRRGNIRIHAKLYTGVVRGVTVVESIWPHSTFVDGMGINALTGADAAKPNGGAAFHDNAIWVRKA